MFEGGGASSDVAGAGDIPHSAAGCRRRGSFCIGAASV